MYRNQFGSPNMDAMLAMSPYSNQYPMSPADNIAGGYGNIASPDKVIMMLAKSLADLQGTAIDTETPQTLPYTQRTNKPITNEDIAGPQIPKQLQRPEFDVTMDNNGRWFYKYKGTQQWHLYQ